LHLIDQNNLDVYYPGMNSVNKRERFVALTNKRVNRTIKDLRLIGNLSNRSAYAYTEEDVRKIIRALQRELDNLKGRFGGGESGDTEFRL
jgi:hypothetical protein